MERPLIAVGASVVLHALACGAVVAMRPVLAPATITPPRVLYAILPEPEAIGSVAGHRAPVGDRVVKTKPRALPQALGETISVKPEPPSRPIARPALKEDEAARFSPGEAPPHFLPLALEVTAVPETAKLATGPAARESPADAPAGRAETGHAPGGDTLRDASMGSPGGAGTGAEESGFTGGGHGGEHLAALPPGGSMSLAIPRYSDNPKPAYPWRALFRGEQGVVLLLVRVSEVGRVSDVRISRSSGSTALDEAALTVVGRWIFHPARRGDRAVDMWVQVPVQFRLEDR